MFLVFFFVMDVYLYSESVFTYGLKKDIVISTISIGVFFSRNLMSSERESGIPSNNLNRNDVNIFDRGLIFPSSNAIDSVRNYLSPVLFVLPAISPLAVAGLDIRRRQNFDTWLTYGIMYSQALLLSSGTRRFFGRAIDRYRPRYYFMDVKGRSSCMRSFPSGTTAYAFMPATFFSVTFSAEFPESPWRIPVIAASHTLAAIIGASRIFGGRHFLTDVLAGAALGSFYGWLIPTLHRRTNEESIISPVVTGNGIMLSLKF